LVTAVESTTTSTEGDAGSSSTTSAPVLGDGSTFVAVRIDNAPDARPQIGLSQASMVIEAPVEGGMTRFTAFYAPGSAPQVVGPVRSLRPVDADLIAPFSTTVIATGGQSFVLQDVTAAGVSLALPDTVPGFTALPRPEPYNIFIRVAEVESAYPPVPVDEPGFAEGEVVSGTPATVLELDLGTQVVWSYEEGQYTRTQDGEPFEVYSDYEGDLGPYTADVILVLSAAERSAGYTDTNDADVPTFDVVGSGDLLLFAGGEVVEGTWSRSAQEDAWVLTADDGTTIGIPDGRLHVMVVPRELELSY
jgi:hypothetical protein